MIEQLARARIMMLVILSIAGVCALIILLFAGVNPTDNIFFTELLITTGLLIFLVAEIFGYYKQTKLDKMKNE